jgi:hypothetical protein
MKVVEGTIVSNNPLVLLVPVPAPKNALYREAAAVSSASTAVLSA